MHYTLGQLNGEWTQYCNLDGNSKCDYYKMINYIGNYKVGYKDGTWFHYGCSGSGYNGDCSNSIIVRENYKIIDKTIHNKVYTVSDEDGKWIYYNEDGTIKKEEIYKDGKLIETRNIK